MAVPLGKLRLNWEKTWFLTPNWARNAANGRICRAAKVVSPGEK
jgi:hypothetical protein